MKTTLFIYIIFLIVFKNLHNPGTGEGRGVRTAYMPGTVLQALKC